MWLAYVQKSEGRRLRHGHNGKEYRLSELQRYSVDRYCEQSMSLWAVFSTVTHVSRSEIDP